MPVSRQLFAAVSRLDLAGNRCRNFRCKCSGSAAESVARSVSGSRNGLRSGSIIAPKRGAEPLTCRPGSFRTGRKQEHGGKRMRGSKRSLLRQSSVLIVLSCAFAVGASQALAQDPAPEPAPPNSSGPKPEAPPGAKRQPEQPATSTTPPPAPPRATPPPPAATNPPPAAVTPPPAPVYQPATTQIRRDNRTQSHQSAKPKPKPKPKIRDKPDNEGVKVAVAAPPGFSRDQATSPDTLLMVGGLALFFLVLADVVFLTLSTRVLRTR